MYMYLPEWSEIDHEQIDGEEEIEGGGGEKAREEGEKEEKGEY